MPITVANTLAKSHLKLTKISAMKANVQPKFEREQRVSFLGGSGVVKSLRSESGIWTYLIEMEMQLESPVGRVGSETWVVLSESDIVRSTLFDNAAFDNAAFDNAAHYPDF